MPSNGTVIMGRIYMQAEEYEGLVNEHFSRLLDLCERLQVETSDMYDMAVKVPGDRYAIELHVPGIVIDWLGADGAMARFWQLLNPPASWTVTTETEPVGPETER